MFNGIIYNTGNVIKINKRSKGINIFLKSKIKLRHKSIGMSIACDGVCLTLISKKKNLFLRWFEKTFQRNKRDREKNNFISRQSSWRSW